MTLTETIKAGFAELKTLLSAKPAEVGDAAAKLKDFETKFTSLSTDMEKLTLNCATGETTIKDLNAQVVKLTGEATAKDGEITSLKAAAKTAGEVAVDLVAATGLDAAQLPAAGRSAADKSAKPSLREQYLALSRTDAVAASKFYAENQANPLFWKS
jgi:hypothetical protein